MNYSLNHAHFYSPVKAFRAPHLLRALSWVFASLMMLLAPPVQAQVATGDILGTVSDSSGALVPGRHRTGRKRGAHTKFGLRSLRALEVTPSALCSPARTA